MNRIDVRGLPLDDMTAVQLVDQVRRLIGANGVCTAQALHATALEARRSPQFRHAVAAADIVYADGYSVSLLGRAFGARRAERLATTDLFDALVRDGAFRRLAMVGGLPGVAERAARNLSIEHGVETVFATHGYHRGWSDVLAGLSSTAPDLVLVGLGMPLESLWLAEHRGELPPALYLTCGGMLRILAHDERRSPMAVQRMRLEWLFRLVTDPRRTWRRYGLGAAHMTMLLASAAASRVRGALGTA
jgi:N-acetylglucosaminyldiphosphoundecaprenol N-acetyl-beta-D-mannosaminyltransferase